MSHFLDRLSFATRAKGEFAGGHGGQLRRHNMAVILSPHFHLPMRLNK